MNQVENKQWAAFQDYFRKQKGVKECLELMPEKAESIDIYFDILIKSAKENPYLCEMVVRSNSKDTGISYSDKKAFQYLDNEGQKISVGNAFAISLVAEGMNLAQKYQIDEEVKGLKSGALSPLLPGLMVSTLKEMGYETPPELYSDVGGVIRVEGERQGSRYGSHSKRPSTPNIDLESKLSFQAAATPRRPETTQVFYIDGLFESRPAAQPEGI